MPFKLNAYLPSKKKEVQIKELTYKQYRELVKSLYNVDKKETIQQYNSILQDLCPDISLLDLTYEDKLSLLLTVRNYCVSPDLKEEVSIEFSSYKARDEYIFIGNNKDIFIILASYIDCIKTSEQIVEFKDYTIEERLEIINSLPQYIVNQVYKSIEEMQNYYEKQILLEVKNPITKETVLTLTCNINYEVLQKVIEFIFTEDLNNIYRAFFNVVNYAGFSPEYIDSITPIEAQVYWMYYLEDREKVSKESTTNNSNLSLPAALNKELGF